ncbi:MAG: ABC transporter ATP-binding protein, partial [Raoultibacter sp.]
EIEVFDLSNTVLDEIKALPCTRRATYDNKTLSVTSSSGTHNLSDVLHVIQTNDISFGRVYAEPPTLNDVFLEITGKELRD